MSHLQNKTDRFSEQNKTDRFSDRYISRVTFTLIGIGLSFWFTVQPLSAQARIYFNPRFLSNDLADVADLSAFEKGQEVPPGTYRVDVYLNDSYKTTYDVTFSAGENVDELIPWLSPNQLANMGVSSPAVGGMEALPKDTSLPLTGIIKEASSHFDVGHQRLNLSVPQAFMGNSVRDYIPPELWDDGINAGLLNYNFSGSSDYMHLNLQSGLNIGAWRLRDNSYWSSTTNGDKSSESQWAHMNTWLERDIKSLRSRVTVGDNYTSNDIFDSIQFRGAKLSSDDNMLPNSQTGFAPVVRGIAHGTAQVFIKQNGYDIYHITVPAGPFIINDLSASGNGDLQVIIKEDGGTSQTFSVPWSTVPLLQREGRTHYELTIGEYRSGNDQQASPTFFQSSLLHGLPNGWTVYGGTQLADSYHALNFGFGKNMGVYGALTADITHAKATLSDYSSHQGQSLRFLYNKSFTETNTSIGLVGYRYSTDGFYNFSDTTYREMNGYDEPTVDEENDDRFNNEYNYYDLNYNKRAQVQFNVSQQLGTTSSLYLSGGQQTYWGIDGVNENIQVGLSNSFNDITATLSYSLTKDAWVGERDQILSVNISIPFSHWLDSDSSSFLKNANARYSISNTENGEMSNTAGISGTLLADNNLSYNIQAGYNSGGTYASGENGYASLSYRGGYGNANFGYSQSDGSNELFYSLSGGILAHANGVTFSQPMDDTVVLIKAPGAGDTKVENQIGVYTDWRGYAVQPYATNYRDNRIALDTNSLATNVDLDSSVVHLVPNRGAVVRANFKAKVGLKILMTLTHNHKPVPFGATATLGNELSGGMVASNGEVYMTGMPLAGKVKVKWGKGPDTSCVVDYQLPEENQLQMLSKLSAVCY